jgi:hypothetical protein
MRLSRMGLGRSLHLMAIDAFCRAKAT